MGCTITHSAARLEEVALLHQKLASSMDGMQAMMVHLQGVTAEQQATLALVAGGVGAGWRGREDPAVHDAMVQTDVPLVRHASAGPQSHGPVLSGKMSSTFSDCLRMGWSIVDFLLFTPF